MSIMFFFKDLISIRATFAMVGANATVEPLMGQRFKPMGGTIIKSTFRSSDRVHAGN